MAAAPNQNNLAEVIKDTIKALGVLQTATEEAEKELADAGAQMEKNVDNVLKVVKGIVDINTVVSNAKIDPGKFKKNIQVLGDFIDVLVEGLNAVADKLDKAKPELEKINNRLNEVKPIIESVNQVLEDIVPLVTAQKYQIKVGKALSQWLKLLIIMPLFVVAVTVIVLSFLIIGKFKKFIDKAKESIIMVTDLLKLVAILFEVVCEMKVNMKVIMILMFLIASVPLLCTVITLIAGVISAAWALMDAVGAGEAITAICACLPTIFQALKMVLDVIKGMKIGGLVKKIATLAAAMNPLQKLVEKINQFFKFLKGLDNPAEGAAAAKQLSESVDAIKDLIKNLLTLMPLGFLFLLAAPMIIIILFGIKMVMIVIKWLTDGGNLVPGLGAGTPFSPVAQVTEKTSEKEVTKGTGSLKKIILGIGLLVLAIVALGMFGKQLIPLIMKAIMMLGILILFVLAVKLFAFIVKRLVNISEVVAILLLGVIVTALVILSLELWVLGLIANKVTKYLGKILIFLVGLVIIMVIMAVIGFLASYLLPYIIMGSIALVVIVAAFAIIVLCILAIAVMLWLLQHIELDPDAIMETVDTIFNIIWAILKRLYEGSNPEEGDTSGFMGFLKSILGRVGDIIMLLAGCTMLILSFVAVTALLLISWALWLLQKVNLDEEKIMENINTIFNIVDEIIRRVWQKRDEDNEKTNRGVLGDVIEWALGEGFAKVLEALASMLYLFMIFISVLMVLAIAGTLALLQKIDLKEDKILDNVDMVFNLADMVIARVWEPTRSEESNATNRGILVTVVRILLGEGTAKVIEALMSMLYLFLIFISTAMILGICKMLEFIQDIQLNEDKILDNVDMTFRLANMIIDHVWQPGNEEAEASKRGILITVVRWVLGEGTAKVIEALLSMIYLFLIFISSAILLGIVKMLQNIQDIELNEDKVMDNVKLVFRCADAMIEHVFTPAGEEANPSNRGILLTIVGWVFSEGMVKIIEALLGMIYLFLIYISMIIVLGIAKLLKDIQDLDLDEKKVLKNVDMVFKCADHCMKKVFKPEQDREQRAGSWIGKLIGFIAPTLGAIIDALLMILNLALIYMAICIVKDIAMTIAEICKLPDLKSAQKKVDDVFAAAKYIINAVFYNKLSMPEVKGDKKWWWMFVPLPNSVLQYMERMKGLNAVNTALGIIKEIARQIQMVYECCKEVDLNAARDMVDKVLDVAELVADRVFNNDVSFNFLEPKKEDQDFARGLMGRFGNTLWGAEIARDRAKAEAYENAMLKVQALTMCSTVLAAVKDMAENIKSLQEVDIPDNLDDVKKKVTNILQLAGEVVDMLFSADFKITLPELSEEQKAAILAANTTTTSHTESRYWGLSKKTTYTTTTNYAQAAEDMYNERLRQLEMRVQIISMTAAVVATLAGMSEQIIQLSKTQLPATKPVLDLIDDLIRFASDIYYRLFSGDILRAFQIGSVKGGGLYTYNSKDIEDRSTKITGMAGVIGTIFGIITDLTNGYLDMAKKISDAKVSDKTMNTVDALFDTVVRLVTRMNEWNTLDINDWQIKKVKSSIGTVMDIVKQVNDGIKKAGKIDVPQSSGWMSKSPLVQMIDDAVKCLEIISNSNSDEGKVTSRLRLMDKMNETMSGFTKISDKDVANTRKVTQNYVVLLDKIEKMNLNKLSLGESMMRHFATLALKINGDFNGLAKAMNDNIAPMLDKLQKTLDEVNKAQVEIMRELSEPIDLNVPDMGSMGGLLGSLGDGSSSGGSDSGSDATQTSLDTPTSTTSSPWWSPTTALTTTPSTQTGKPTASTTYRDSGKSTDLKKGQEITGTFKIINITK